VFQTIASSVELRLVKETSLSNVKMMNRLKAYVLNSR